MPLRDWLKALFVVTVWGLNFVAIRLALDDFPPMLLGAMRFILVALPAVLFIPRPSVSWRAVAGYGVTISMGQFMFLFTGIYLGMPAGLASLVLQSQAFFSVLIGALFLKERVRLVNIIGMLIASLGLALIYTSGLPGSIPFIGFMLTLLAALSWASGNIIIKVAGKTDMLSLVVWSSLIPPIPFLMLSWWLEGPELISSSFANVSMVGVISVGYLVFISTMMGFVTWGRLLHTHPVRKIAPLSLLIPVVGLISASIFLDEYLTSWQWLGGLVALFGLGVNIQADRLYLKKGGAARATLK